MAIMTNQELKHKNSFYTCKRLRLLEFLKSKGFMPAKTIPDANNPCYNWWLFKNTADLERVLEEYFKEKCKKEC
jgi:hypothetical protein